MRRRNMYCHSKGLVWVGVRAKGAVCRVSSAWGVFHSAFTPDARSGELCQKEGQAPRRQRGREGVLLCMRM